MKAFSRISARLLELELHASRLPPAVESVVGQITTKLARDSAWDVAEQLLRVLLPCWSDERLLGLLEIEAERNEGSTRNASTRCDTTARHRTTRELADDRRRRARHAHGRAALHPAG